MPGAPPGRLDRPGYLLLLLCLLPACRLGGPSGGSTSESGPSRGPAPTLEQARAFYAAQPSHLRPVPAQAVPAGLPDLRASTCGTCHEEIYAEWRISTHARAWMDDPQFQAELNKGDPAESDVRWMCVNCHTPLENQLERLVVGLEAGRLDRPTLMDNPHFDPALQLEAITCATCHVRDGVILGPLGVTTAPHPVKQDPGLLSASSCTTCHNARASFPELKLACVFSTGDEHAQSPQAAQGMTCQTCHMPEAVRPLTSLGTPPRQTRRHWFGGSLIPKKPELADELRPLLSIFPDGLTTRWIDLPERLKAGSLTRLELELANANAGHALPTGDPERFLLLRIEARGTEGNLLGQADTRIGSVYSWWPEVRLESDNRLRPLERRRLTLEFQTPGGGQVSLRVVASKWRISEENLRYHQLEGSYPAGRTFLDETLRLDVAPPEVNAP